MLIGLSALMLEGGATTPFEAPARDTILDWVGTAFEPMEGGAQGDPVMERVVGMLRSDPRSDRWIADIAGEVGLSGPELSRRFSKRHHMTPTGYRKQQRLAVATRALAAGQSVSAAAHAAGFSDAAHLSRTFKDQYGISPSRWAGRVARP